MTDQTTRTDYPDILNLEEAAGFLRFTPKTLYNMARQGGVPCVKISRRWRFSKAALEEWAAGRWTPPAKNGKR